MLSQFWLQLYCMLNWEYKITSLGIRYRFQPGFQNELQQYYRLQNMISVVVVTQSRYVTSFEVINAHVQLATTDAILSCHWVKKKNQVHYNAVPQFVL